MSRPHRTATSLFAFCILISAAQAGTSPTITTVAGGGPDDVPARSAAIGAVTAMALDAGGQVYLASRSLNRIVKVSPTGRLTVVAGNGVYAFGFPRDSFGGDGGQARDAFFSSPTGVALDLHGNLYIADSGNRRVRRVDGATGVITTIAGDGTAASTGDGGPAASARLNEPVSVAVDGGGNLFIAEAGGHRIRRVDSATGLIATVAGTGAPGYGGDGGPAVDAGLQAPRAIALDGAGNLLIADTDNNRLRRVAATTGIITTLAGDGTAGFNGDGIAAGTAWLNRPFGVTVDAAGDILIADTFNLRVRKIAASSGLISTIVGTGTFGYGLEGVSATSAPLNFPLAVVAGGSGRVFVSESRGPFVVGYYGTPNRVRAVDGASQLITSFAGNGQFSFSGDGGPAELATLSAPRGLAVDDGGDLYIADNYNGRIRVRSSSSGLITTIAGNGSSGFAGDGGPATAATLGPAFALAVDSARNLFIADTTNNRVRRVDAVTGIITTVAGNGSSGYSGDGGPATSASLSGPTSVAVDGAGNLFLADYYNHRVRRVDGATGIITTFAGDGSTTFHGEGGPATTAGLDPLWLAVDGAGNLFIGDFTNIRVFRVDAASGILTTAAGTRSPGVGGDGLPATKAGLGIVTAIAADGPGNLYILGGINFQTRRVDAASGIIDAFAGNGRYGFSGDGGPATDASFVGAWGIAVDRPGDHVYISDFYTQRVRAVGSVESRPRAAAAALQTGCAAAGMAPVTLDGVSSTDADSTPGTHDDIALFEWFEDYGQPGQRSLGTGETLDVSLPVGPHLVTLVVTDQSGRSDTDEITIDVVAATPIALSLALTPETLWPPNHQMIGIAASVVPSGACGVPIVSLVSITSDEPDDSAGGGDGQTVNDIQGAVVGTADFAFLLRAERDGSGAGRTYTVTYSTIDEAGRTVTATAEAFVPRDRGGVTDPMAVSIEERSSGTVVSWRPVPGALRYNVIRGALGSIRDTGQALDLSAPTCIDSRSSNLTTSGKDDRDVPLAGRAFFYLVEYDDGVSRSGFGEPDAEKERVAASGGCP